MIPSKNHYHLSFMDIQNEDTQEVEETSEEEQEEQEGNEEEQEEDEEQEEEAIDWEAKARELEGRNKRLQTKLEKQNSKKTKAKKTNDGEIDYGQLAFYNSDAEVPVKSEADIEYLQDMMDETGMTQKELLGKKWFINELKEKQEAQAVKQAVPTSNKRRGQSEVNEVDYWLAKPEGQDLPPVEQVELRRKVLNEKIKRAKNKSKFASQGIVQGA